MKTLTFSAKTPLNTVISDESGTPLYSISTPLRVMGGTTTIYKSTKCDIPATQVESSSGFLRDGNAQRIQAGGSVSMEEMGQIVWHFFSGTRMIYGSKALDVATFMPPTQNLYRA